MSAIIAMYSDITGPTRPEMGRRRRCDGTAVVPQDGMLTVRQNAVYVLSNGAFINNIESSSMTIPANATGDRSLMRQTVRA